MTGGIIVTFIGYAVISYGVVLLRNYDVPWSRWINPLNPWQWPDKGKPPTIPSTRVLPA